MNQPTFLTNHFLIAMPNMADPYFNHSVTYICEHTENGAIGIIINRPLEINLIEVFKQMEITSNSLKANEMPVLCGGPVHPERGFVLHTPGGNWRSTLEMSSEISVTTSRDILQAMAADAGPPLAMVSLGYASWLGGQLEQEIIENVWLVSPASAEILFNIPFAERWDAAVHMLGFDIHNLSDNVGHA